MKKILVLLSLVCVWPLTGHAQDVDGKAETEFQANNGPVAPVDPDEGNEVVPVYPPTNGPLSLSYAADLEFGSHKFNGKESSFLAENYTVTQVATNKAKQYPPFVQINDLRGSGAGWTLAVKQNSPLAKENGVEIANSQFKISALSAESPHGMTQQPSTLYSKNVSNNGETVPIISAKEGEGMGTWTIFLGDMGSQNPELSVPLASVKETGRYQTSLTWILQDVL
ncbi:WxL domain-containing protein [Vagococcus sp. BWB3-3]|uniref:WxL domain-containing protein n=1 Tax=Vagococcus allomyrinae TaxID=2794353 RepID=A0A940P2J5_9ENTE|nr:WxL domain-containing protein [Vagococcus allomyrinae]MBP1040264.1 WxL domain-containing protein [Vagococcus allomyrinae]